MLIDAVTKVRGDWPRPDLRTTSIHANAFRICWEAGYQIGSLSCQPHGYDHRRS